MFSLFRTFDSDYHPQRIWGKVIYTGRNEVVAKVIFLHLSVILFTGGVCLSACWDATTTPLPRRPPPTKETPLSRRPPVKETPSAKETPLPRRPSEGGTPLEGGIPLCQGHLPCQGDPLGRSPRHTVNERPVHILLEGILLSEVCVKNSVHGGGGRYPSMPCRSHDQPVVYKQLHCWWV